MMIRMIDFWLAVFVLLGITGATWADDAVQELRVLSYNIHIGIGMDDKLDLERTARTILLHKPDIVALQEVDRLAERTEKMNQPELLSKLTGMEIVFGKTLNRSGGEYGIAILSKYPIQEHKYTQLPRLGDREDRGVLEAKIEIDGKTPLLFACTHFCHESEERRTMQAVKVNELLAQNGEERWTIIGGDFNARPESETIATMLEKWSDATNSEPTCCNPAPQVKIDYIFYRPKEALKVKETMVIDDAMTSDHRPVLTVFELEYRNR